MNYSKAIFLISDDVRAINVIYEPKDKRTNAKISKRQEEYGIPVEGKYTFKTLDKNIKVDDYVVVQTNTRHGMTVCQVVETDMDIDFDDQTELKWIVGTVNKADFDELKRQEDEAISRIKSAEKRRKRDELREALINDVNGDLKALPIYTVNKEDKKDAVT